MLEAVRRNFPFWKRARIACLLLVLMAALPVSAAKTKVLLYRTPFGATPVCVFTNYGLCSDTTTGVMSRSRSDGWLSLDMTSAYASMDQYASYTVYKQGTYSSEGVGSVTLSPLFANSDTVWLVPNPYPAGSSVSAYTSNPLDSAKLKVVMLWNPWTGQVPKIEIGTTWDSMTVMGSNSGLYGWCATTMVGYTANSGLTLLFANSAKTEYLNSAGINSLANLPISIDSIAKSSDTIWIRAYPEGNAKGVKESSTRMVPRQVMTFNPWNGMLPVQHPLVSFAGNDTLRSMSASADFCGWYSYAYFDRTPLVHLTNQKTGKYFGAKGYGDATDINLAALGDTGWISITPDSLPRLTSSATSDRGLCEISYLAATVRDFATGRPATSSVFNREFGRGSGCGRGGWSVVKGMVDTILGADRKPVRSAHDTGAEYPNSWSYAFRCTYDTSEPASLAEIGDSGIATNWFKTVAGKNTETCRDIPLALDSATGNYVYDAPLYFPIDDLKNLPDGSINPYYDQISGQDGKSHNFGFCLESHGNFEYKKGQVFRFAGDDDVWFFINKRLAVDLGGIHPTAKDSVFLDTIGSSITSRWVNNKQVYDTAWTSARLVEGSTYNFDFFFCERNPQGSDMMISTSMNLRTDAGFIVRDSQIAVGVHNYDVYVSTTSGQGCKATTDIARATSVIRLVGGSLTAPQRLSTGIRYGGIVVDSAAGNVRIDTGAIIGLPAGRYTVQFIYLKDTTVVRSYTFTVPYSAGPKFVSTPPYTGVVSSSFPVSVGAYNATGPDSGAVQFVLRPVAGLSFFRDSLLTEPVHDGDTLMTGSNTVARRFWVRGDMPGSYRLVIGKISQDSADGYDEILFQDKGLRFIDSAGKPLSPLPAIDRLFGDTVRIWFETYSAATTCAICGDSVRLSSPAKGLRFLDTTGKERSSFALSGGRGSALVTSIAPLTGASFLAGVVGDASSQATWTPVSFRVLPPDSAEAYDRDGDGAVDRFVVHLHQKWSAGSALSFAWPDTSAFVSSSKGKVAVSADSLTVTVDFPAGAFLQATMAKVARGAYSWGGEPSQTFGLSDRIAPVAMRAVLAYGRSGAPDTLDVSLSEVSVLSDKVHALSLLESGAWGNATPSSLSLAGNGMHLLALYDAASLKACPFPGDSARLGAGVADTFRNVPGAMSKAVVVEGGPRPPSRGWYLDSDGDGAVELAVVLFPLPVRGDSLPSLDFSLPVAGALEKRTGKAVRLAGDSSRLVVPLSAPFAKGVTSFDGTGLGTMDGSWPFDMADSVAPAILSAALHLTENYTDPDTLVVVPSEALSLDMSSAWFQVKNKDSLFVYSGSSRDSAGGVLRVLVAPNDPAGIRAGDSLRYVWNGAVQDAFGNIPLATAIWHPITGGKHRAISKLVPPLPLVRISKEADLPNQSAPLQVLATRGDTTVWYPWQPGTGYENAKSTCPTSICNGPELILNSPVSIAMHVYDQMGVHVTGTSLTVDSAALEGLERDRLGRTRVRLSWDYRSDAGARVVDGVYLLRLILVYPSDEAERQKMVNQIWRIGLSRSEMH